MIGSKKTFQSDVKQEFLSCMRPRLLNYAAITPPWATQSFTTYIMASWLSHYGQKIEKSGLA
jgi:hypothetical protein